LFVGLMLVLVDHKLDGDHKIKVTGMKNIFYPVLLFLFIGCSTDSNPYEKGIENFNQNVKTADKLFDLFVSGDLDKLAEYYVSDFIWSPPVTGMDSLPKDVWMKGMQDWHAEFEGFSFDNREYYPSVSDKEFIPDGSVRVYGVWTTIHKKTKTLVKTKYYAVFMFNDDGKIAENYEWYDYGGVFDQIEKQGSSDI